ncbi:MAG: hypothetical protein NDJ92_11370, partial [Thermoanaerobaculia bacterium]|nr:hypothetical protein [Thermoanaerobaculia bacterium]
VALRAPSEAPDPFLFLRMDSSLSRGMLPQLSVHGNREAQEWFRNDRTVDYFTLDLSRVAALFADAFVETVWLTDDARADGAPTASLALPHDGYVPYFEEIPNHNERDWISRKWMRSATRRGIDRRAEDNHQVFFAASYYPGLRGGVKVADGFNDGWIFTKNMGKAHPGKILAHELAHEWRVNQVYSPILGNTPASDDDHCNEIFTNPSTVPAYTGNEACVMNSDIGDIPDGEKSSARFHYVVAPGGAVDSEYITIRERMEPVPQSEENNRNRYFH